ncbi:MAG: hypothetical protein ACM65L_24475 [Microcoleus sp.]
MAYQIQYTLKNYCKWVEFAGKGDREHPEFANIATAKAIKAVGALAFGRKILE